jgi:hypothetical protein
MFKLLLSAQDYLDFKSELKKEGYSEIIEHMIMNTFPAIFYADLIDGKAKIKQLDPELINNYVRAIDDMWK